MKRKMKNSKFVDTTVSRLCTLLVMAVLSTSLLLPSSGTGNNIIIISVDTLRADHLGCYGYPVNTSPEIDKFSKEGILFSRSFTITPLTAPAFSTMLTSLPPHKHGAKRNGLSVYNHIQSLPGFLKNHGYRNAAFISNWPLRKKLFGLHRDFDHYEELLNHKRYMGVMNREGDASEVTEKAVRWLRTNRNEQMFLWIHYSDPHAPYIFHTQYNFRYDDVPLSSVFPPLSNMKKIRKYDSEIRYSDHYIGKLLAEIRALGLFDQSLIIFNSDHGESFGEHHYYKHGRMLYNSCMQVPLIVKLPGNRQAGTTMGHNVSIIDISPTILGIIGLPVPEYMEGRNIFKPTPDTPLFFEAYKGAAILKRSNKAKLNSNPIRYGVLRGDLKLILTKKKRKFEQYNIRNDIFEVKPLAKKTGSSGRLFKTLIGFVKKLDRFIELFRKKYNQVTEISKEDLEVLKTLGYFND